jgi:DNA modification methylase
VTVRVIHGDCLNVLPSLDAGSVQCCVTSPPYYGLRSYGIGIEGGEVGTEATPDAYVAALVGVFRALWPVLRDDGTLWLNLGDSYARTGGTDRSVSVSAKAGNTRNSMAAIADRTSSAPAGLADKQLLMIPARVALALQADGWYLRSSIIWHKPNPMPESCRDRPTSSYEHVFLLTKRASYYYDTGAVREPISNSTIKRWGDSPTKVRPDGLSTDTFVPGGNTCGVHPDGRNARNVWTIATQPNSLAHFAMMPAELAERCIKAGSRAGDTVLDPFAGAGTTALVSDRLQRHAIGIELNPANAVLARGRVLDDAGLFGDVA